MKAKETASEASRKGRLSLGWCGKGCCEDTRKKFTFQSGGGEQRADKNGNRGGESSGKFKSSSKGGACLSSLFDERGLWLKIIGSFSNDDGDGKEDVKKAIALLRKTTILHVHHAFLYMSLPSLHDYDVKIRGGSRGRVQGVRTLP